MFDVGVCVLIFFYILCGYQSGLILWFLDNLWFDGLRAVWVADRLSIVFGRDVILCGCLGLKYQLTN